MEYLNGCGFSKVDGFVLKNNGRSYNYHYEQIKILNLVLYSTQEYYQKMYELTSPFYKKFENVKTVYYCYADIDEEYKLVEDILFIKGVETYSPGIYNKMIKAFNYFKEESQLYDYVVRTNISTIVNFNLLRKYLDKYPVLYGGDKMDVYGLTWVRGTCIIINKNLFYNIMEEQSKMMFLYVDDVSLGHFVRTHFNLNLVEYMTSKEYTNNYHEKSMDYVKNNDISDIIYFRNNSWDRYADVKVMKLITEKI